MNGKRKILTAPFCVSELLDKNRYCLISISWNTPDKWDGIHYGSVGTKTKELENKIKGIVPRGAVDGYWDGFKSVHDFLEDLKSKNLKSVLDDIFELSSGKIPVLMDDENHDVVSVRCIVADWIRENTDNHGDVEVVEFTEKTSENTDREPIDTYCDEMVKKTAIRVLEEFNRWRRGQGEYQWNEDPSKNKQLDFNPTVIGEAIDFAVEYIKKH